MIIKFRNSNERTIRKYNKSISYGGYVLRRGETLKYFTEY